jgi:hypothetical protein
LCKQPKTLVSRARSQQDFGCNAIAFDRRYRLEAVARSSIMILGLSFEAFTQLHVVLSLIGIATGAAAAFGERFDVLKKTP